MLRPVVETMREIGYKRAYVVHGMDAQERRGLDELSTLGPTHVAELNEDGEIRTFAISYEELGIEQADEKVIMCKLNRDAEAIEQVRVLSGEDHGSRRDIVCFNAAPILYITGHASDLAEGYHKACDLIDSGKAIRKLTSWVAQQQSGDASEKVERLEKMIGAVSA
jgi:anthranilate phosphoribosyltransferase